MFLVSISFCAVGRKQNVAQSKQLGPAVVCNYKACSKLEGAILITIERGFYEGTIVGEDGRYVVVFDFNERVVKPVFLRGIGFEYMPHAISASRDRFYFEGRYKPRRVEGEAEIPTFFECVYRIGEYEVTTKKIRYLFEGPFIASAFSYSVRDNLIIFDAWGPEEFPIRELPKTHFVFKLDVASGEAEKVITSEKPLSVNSIAEAAGVFFLTEGRKAGSRYRYVLCDYEGRLLRTVPISEGDGVLSYPAISANGKRVVFRSEKRGNPSRVFSVYGQVREGLEVFFIQGSWSEEFRSWFRGPYCFSPDGRYLILLFAKDPWPRYFSEVTLVLYDLDTGESDWLVRAEYAPAEIQLDWQQ